MKKFIKTIIIAVAVGVIFGIIFFNKKEPLLSKVINQTESIYLIQLGIFKNYDNAFELSKKYDGVIIEDSPYYRVVFTILKNEENINKAKRYLIDNNIDYYLKKIIVSNNNFVNYLNDIESLYKETDDIQVILELNKKIITKYKEMEE